MEQVLFELLWGRRHWRWWLFRERLGLLCKGLSSYMKAEQEMFVILGKCQKEVIRWEKRQFKSWAVSNSILIKKDSFNKIKSNGKFSGPLSRLTGWEMSRWWSTGWRPENSLPLISRFVWCKQEVLFLFPIFTPPVWSSSSSSHEWQLYLIFSFSSRTCQTPGQTGRGSQAAFQGEFPGIIWVWN